MWTGWRIFGINVPKAIIPSYSSNWSQGGPIIERERISIGLSANGAQWVAHISNAPKSKKHWTHGPTPLIAAMRCYVAFKLGEEVEIPNELINKE